MRRSTRSHRGVASLVALGMLALVAVAVGALVVLVRTDVNRTFRQSTDAQLRQLLLAGTTEAKRLLGSGGMAQATDLALPPAIASQGAAVRLTPGTVGPDRAELQVRATWGDASLVQSLRFRRDASGWALEAARLGD